MAELQFEPLIELEQTFNCTNMGNEPNNKIIQYGISNERQLSDLSEILNAKYEGLMWKSMSDKLTTKSISRIGIKTFPQIGAIAFLNLKNENKSIILAPVFTNEEKYKAPTFKVKNSKGKTIFTITDPSGVSYDCYRISIHDGEFRTEYITYQKELQIDEISAETYLMSICGYIGEIQMSEEWTGEVTMF